MSIATFFPLHPYNFDLTARLMARYHGVLDIWQPPYYRRALFVEDTLVLVQVTANNTPGQPLQLHIEPLAASGAVNTQALVSTMRRMLRIDENFMPFTTLARSDAHLWRIVEPLVGLHHWQAPTMFEALAMVIIEQQISLAAALRAQRALANWGGAQIDHEGQTYYAFPTPTQIAAAEPQEIQAITKITHRRAATLHTLAQAIRNGHLDLESLRARPAEAAYQMLINIKMIGHWSVAWTLIRGLSRYDYIGHNDVALRAAVAHYFYQQKDRVPSEVVTTTFEHYGEHAGLAAFYTLMRWATERY